MKKSFFNYKYYNTFMYIAISLTILLIFFSMLNLIDKNKFTIKENSKIKKITGYSVEEDLEKKELENKNELKGEVYTEKSYLIYYLLLLFLGLCSFILTIIFFLPRIKELS